MKIPPHMEHATLGTLRIVESRRARRFTFRPEGDGLRVTVPVAASLYDLERCLDEMLPRLERLLAHHREQNTQRVIRAGCRITTERFTARVEEGSVRRPCARLKAGELLITCPAQTRYEEEGLQAWLVKVMEEALRHVAKQTLPTRLKALAERHGMRFGNVSIHKTRGRWGSCSAARNINLSLYLLLLPVELQDYVMLHELCHTVEMNHGPRFWARLDEMTGGRSAQLRSQMKGYSTNVFPYLQVD